MEVGRLFSYQEGVVNFHDCCKKMQEGYSIVHVVRMVHGEMTK